METGEGNIALFPGKIMPELQVLFALTHGSTLGAKTPDVKTSGAKQSGAELFSAEVSIAEASSPNRLAPNCPRENVIHRRYPYSTMKPS